MEVGSDPVQRVSSVHLQFGQEQACCVAEPQSLRVGSRRLQLGLQRSSGCGSAVGRAGWVEAGLNQEGLQWQPGMGGGVGTGGLGVPQGEQSPVGPTVTRVPEPTLFDCLPGYLLQMVRI